jgi:hypothetical protein
VPPWQRCYRTHTRRRALRAARRCAQAALPFPGFACAADAPLLPPLASRLDGEARLADTAHDNNGGGGGGGAPRRARAPRAGDPPGAAARSACQVVGCTTSALRLNAYNKRVRRAHSAVHNENTSERASYELRRKGSLRRACADTPRAAPRRRRLCPDHLRAPHVLVGDVPSRFCQKRAPQRPCMRARAEGAACSTGQAC